jgi:hypothetical protein
MMRFLALSCASVREGHLRLRFAVRGSYAHHHQPLHPRAGGGGPEEGHAARGWQEHDSHAGGQESNMVTLQREAARGRT